MEVFYELQPDIYAKYVPKIAQDLRDEISFRAGTIIQEPLPLPLIFTTGHSAQELPKGMHGRVIPVMSDEFIAALQQAGVSNLQCFPAELKSRVDGTIWKNFQAVNVIGLISCADLNASEFTQIIERPGEDSLPLMAFEDLRIDPARASGALLFRLAESPGIIIIAGRVVDYLRTQKSDEEWGITLDER
jgi:hypothetical protein